jgi:Cysteine-rich secretory protein family
MADRGYANHFIKSCLRLDKASATYQDLLAAAGYSATVTWENIGYNNWPAWTETYLTGCPQLSTHGCVGSTVTANPAAIMQRMWMDSTQHRTNLLRTDLDRFGCAVWYRDDAREGVDMTYFSCIFAGGGPAKLDTTGPSITNVNGQATTIAAGGQFTFTATASDDRLHVAETSVSIDGTLVASWGHDHDGQTVNLAWPVAQAGLADGAHVLTWRARDAAGNVSASAVGFFSRTTSTVKVPAAAFTNPAPTTTALSGPRPVVRWSEDLAASTPADRSLVASWTPQIATGTCGTTWTSTAAVHPTSSTWSGTLVSRRCYRFEVTVTDAFGGVGTAKSGTLIVAGTPIVKATSPVASAVRSVAARARVRITWQANPNGAPLTRQVLRVYVAKRPAAGCRAVRSWTLSASLTVGATTRSKLLTLGSAKRCTMVRVDVTNAVGLTGRAYSGRFGTR